MSRTIKFRAWDTERNEWIGQHNFNQTLAAILDGPEEWRHVILEQFTGLLDKNGKEIYENDMVAYRNAPHLVEFVDGCFVISHKAEVGEYVDELGAVTDRVEVIGNVHQQAVAKGEE